MNAHDFLVRSLRFIESEIKKVVVLDLRSPAPLEAFLIKQGMLFLAHLCFRRVQRHARAIACLICRSLCY